MNKKEELKAKFEENPVAAIGAVGVALAGVAKLIDAVSAMQGRRAYARQVAYRIKKKG